MRPPLRNSSGYDITAWANEWLTVHALENRIADLAGFDPIKAREISETCTNSEIAFAYKCKVANSTEGWDEKPRSLIARV